jgi:hypothetical protein
MILNYVLQVLYSSTSSRTSTLPVVLLHVRDGGWLMQGGGGWRSDLHKLQSIQFEVILSSVASSSRLRVDPESFLTKIRKSKNVLSLYCTSTR